MASSSDTDPDAGLGDHLVAGLFATHDAADSAIRRLAAAGVPLRAISIVGRNPHTEEHAVGYVNAGERARFYGKYGAFWGGLAGLLLGSGFFFVPFIGSLTALGPLASVLVGGIEGAALGGGASALFGALSTIGVPKDSVLRYETAIRTDQFMVTVHCASAQVAQVHQWLEQAGATEVQGHALTGATN
ncbi:MAG TPA: DUF1269 domain-containing protein [Rubrivivax sp.]|nr:DUF1269 domain-containing protein [Pseudomonadota bacterium]HOL36268.1 DUF1269 domain-containing protein [Rubrivivax sp.]HPP81931.1 DUF1269 domain-containing protein [Rubrivivax sp.]